MLRRSSTFGRRRRCTRWCSTRALRAAAPRYRQAPQLFTILCGRRYLKHLWDAGRRATALTGLTGLVDQLDDVLARRAPASTAMVALGSTPAMTPLGDAPAPRTPAGPWLATMLTKELAELSVRSHLRLGHWQHVAAEARLADPTVDYGAVVATILNNYAVATQHGEGFYKAWHSWAMMHFAAAEHYAAAANRGPAGDATQRRLTTHVVSALTGFFRSVSLGRSRVKAHVLQDLLRLLTLWFNHGARPEVLPTLQAGLEKVNIDTWLQVIPQLIARISTPTPAVRGLLHNLLAKVRRGGRAGWVWRVSHTGCRGTGWGSAPSGARVPADGRIQVGGCLTAERGGVVDGPAAAQFSDACRPGAL